MVAVAISLGLPCCWSCGTSRTGHA